jgi:hypothetical protein
VRNWLIQDILRERVSNFLSDFAWRHLRQFLDAGWVKGFCGAQRVAHERRTAIVKCMN